AVAAGQSRPVCAAPRPARAAYSRSGDTASSRSRITSSTSIPAALSSLRASSAATVKQLRRRRTDMPGEANPRGQTKCDQAVTFYPQCLQVAGFAGGGVGAVLGGVRGQTTNGPAPT